MKIRTGIGTYRTINVRIDPLKRVCEVDSRLMSDDQIELKTRIRALNTVDIAIRRNAKGAKQKRIDVGICAGSRAILNKYFLSPASAIGTINSNGGDSHLYLDEIVYHDKNGIPWRVQLYWLRVENLKKINGQKIGHELRVAKKALRDFNKKIQERK